MTTAPKATPRDRPVIFSAPMVCAILAGSKTQTRRLIAPQPTRSLPHEKEIARDSHGHQLVMQHPMGWRWHPKRRDGWRLFAADDGGDFAGGMVQHCPFGVPGDRLWVRETFKTSNYNCDDESQPDDHECSAHCKQTYVYYRATPRVGYRPRPDKARIRYLDESTPLPDFYENGWKPAIHMFRWASRITLEITAVRIERLKDLSEDDARAEGVDRCWCGSPKLSHPGCCGYRPGFANLWDSINGQRAPWSWNPWVWVLSFKPLELAEHAIPRLALQEAG